MILVHFIHFCHGNQANVFVFLAGIGGSNGQDVFIIIVDADMIVQAKDISAAILLAITSIYEILLHVGFINYLLRLEIH